MNTLLIILLVVLPLLKFVIAPARTMGRGGGSTIFGAVLIVGMMMVIFLALHAITGTVDKPAGSASTSGVTLPGGSAQQDTRDLQKLNAELKKLGL
jgi:hypothetical protein